MAWLTGGSVDGNGLITGLTGVVVSSGGYFETRTDEDDPDITETRPHLTTTTEFRGLADNALSGAFVSGLKTVTRTANHNGAGGYTITQVEDTITGGWQKMQAPPP
jgi:hypothetical protein